MRVGCSKSLDGPRGLNKFLKRLFRCLEENYDVKHVGLKDRCDINLAVIGGLRQRCKNVVRLDGVYYDIKRMRNNQPIARDMRAADGVVFQSKWSHKFCTGMTKVHPKKYTIAYNGIDQSSYDNAFINKHGFDKVFGTCANWRVNKRPEAIQRAFIEARKESGENIGLFLVGDIKNKVSHPAIKYFGQVKGNSILPIYKSMDYFVHICHLDACPNTVVEALSAGCPILSNNIGGTPELTGEDGIILKLDKPFDFKPIKSMDLTGSKYVDEGVLKQGMLDMMSKEWIVNRPDMDISKSAEKYYNFFKSIL